MNVVSVFLLIAMLNFSTVSEPNLLVNDLHLYKGNNEFVSHSSYIQDKISSSVDFGVQIGADCYQDHPLFSEKELIRFSFFLRDTARILGSGFLAKDIFSDEFLVNTDKVTLVVDNDLQTNLHPASFFNFKSKHQESWISLTVGQVLKLITQEIDQLENSETLQEVEKKIDLLIYTKNDTYEQVSNVPLNCYCQSLLQQIKPKIQNVDVSIFDYFFDFLRRIPV